MSYTGRGATTATVSITKTLKYPEGSCSAAFKAVLGPPSYADLYDSGEVRMKWMRAITDGEKLKLLAVKEKYNDYIVLMKNGKQHFDTEHIEKGTSTSVVIKVLANPDQF